MAYTLQVSDKPDKKWMVTKEGSRRKIYFGAAGYDDFTIHRDAARRNLYLLRHKKRENWTVTGINTRGFWSRWLLWNKSTLNQSILDMESRFDIRIKILLID
jgi:hypothetical protein